LGQRGRCRAAHFAVWPACFRLAATVIGDRSLAQDAAQEACAIIEKYEACAAPTPSIPGFNQSNAATCRIWQIPLTSGTVRKFTVDARTFAIMP
jgi:hypothetical protein